MERLMGGFAGRGLTRRAQRSSDAEGAEGGFVERWASSILHSSSGENWGFARMVGEAGEAVEAGEVIDWFGSVLVAEGDGGLMPFLSSVRARRRWVRSRWNSTLTRRRSQ